MTKDRIGNVLAVGDKVIVALPDSSIIGFISDMQEAGVLRTTLRGDHEPMPGRILVSCVISLPVDAVLHATGQIVKVHDADREATQATLEAMKGSTEPAKAN